jgi:hypothetical protein
MLTVEPVSARIAADLVVKHHYLHRRPPISFSYGLMFGTHVVGVVTFGVPASRHLQKSVCPTDPGLCLELNRLWVHDLQPPNSESWFVSRALKFLPPRLIASYADPIHGHVGYIYRALNFYYAGWTDMERKTPRFDYVPADPTTHTRDAFRNGYVSKRRRVAKVRYWIATGDRRERKRLESLCGWPKMDWKTSPPPVAGQP